MQRDELKARIQETIDVLVDRYFDDFPLDVVCMASVKTEAHYLRVLSRAIRDLYAGEIAADDMLQTMVELLDQQMRRAFNQGMRDVGLDPAKDMTDEWEAELQSWIDNEFSFVEKFIADIVSAAENKEPIDPLLVRAELWAARYPEIVDRARALCAPRDLNMVWTWGNTVEHCETCQALNGIVATAAEWAELEARGIYPRSPELACHGFNCQCERVPTDDPVTPGGIPSV